MKRRPLLTLAAMMLASGPSQASETSAAPSATASCGGNRPWLELVLAVEPPDVLIATTLERHLRADLGMRGIDVCVSVLASASSPNPKPIARVKLEIKRTLVPAEAISATIAIDDAITNKRVERTLNLLPMPNDTRPLIVGVATDELLRASWTELAIEDAPAPTMAPPDVVRTAVASSLRAEGAAPRSLPAPARSERMDLSLGFTAAVYPGRRIAAGTALEAAYAMTGPVVATAHLGASYGFARSRPQAEASIDDLQIGLGLGLRFFDTQVWALRAALGGRALVGRYRATSEAGQPTQTGSAWSALLTADLQGDLRLGSALYLYVGLGLRLPTRPLRAVANLDTVTAIESLGLTSTTGFGFRL
jgi:hypothetical protein